jgi:type IV pilus assembly protein PilY1
MGRVLEILRSLAASRPVRWIGVPVALAAGAAAVISQTATLPPTIALAAEPLYARGARAKPTLTLALSVEFPTVGAQYRNATYSSAESYIGYYDSESCYTYNNVPAETRPAGVPVEAYRRFDRSGAATNRTCGGNAFSGNFMNWATGSAIDVLRYGLTGGDRVVDTGSLTVLQRAVLYRSDFYNNASYFPSKRLLATDVSGAVPNTLKGDHNGDVYIANCLNRINFGTVAWGSCAEPGFNSNLGVATPTIASGSKSLVTSFPAGALTTVGTGFGSACANENATCTLSGINEVAYGSSTAGWRVLTVKDSIVCNNANFGDPGTGTLRCYARAKSIPTPTTTVLSSDPFFYARVQVCDSASGTLNDPRPSLCLQYPNGNFKPVGNLQKYSDRLRVAAFGYLNENGNGRYGGVLRAPMKYVGPKSFDANFSLQSGTNTVAEWDETTGVFVPNPDGGSVLSGVGSSPPSTNLSGVINYLNQFGRTGDNPGQYKSNDPVGELYYESLRYLQGLAPTAQATSGMTTAMQDGYPVYTSWTDPHPAVTGMTDYSCVKNNIVGIGDIFTHWDKSIPGNSSRTATGGNLPLSPNDFTRDPVDADNEPNFHYWTSVVGGFESNTTVSYVDGAGAAQPPASAPMNIPANSPYNTARNGMENQGIGSGSSSAYYMAGAAYWANTHDIRGTAWTNQPTKQRPGMRVRTYMIDVNENSASNSVTTRTNSHFYLAAKYGGFNDTSLTGSPFREKLADGSIVESNNNWAGSNGEAKSYFLASSAQALLDALDSIFANISAEANSIAGGAISTQRLTTSGGQIYQAQFDPADWSGDLVAYPVSVSASNVVTIGIPENSPWRNAANKGVGAAGKLDDLAGKGVVGGIDARKIYVGYNSALGTFGTTEFKWGSLNTVTSDLLSAPPHAASGPMSAASAGETRVDYLRGDRTNESNGTYRRRGTRLGDIVNSGVAFSAAPVAQRYADSAYTTFYNDHKNRTKALFVGANDGMMHAFNADTGAELFAYIPSWLAPKLASLTSLTYAHQAYADGSPTVAEAKIDSVWKTVLVSGTGGGGQGVFALDVSNPDAFDNDKVLWEFSDRDDTDMGNVIGHPKILKLNLGAGTTTPNYKYFAVFASGVNNYAADGRSTACVTPADGYCGAPALFMLDLSKAKTTAWQLGSNYYKVRFPVTSAIASGMTEFAVRLGAAEELTYVYAGDLQGNVWKLDFTATEAADWSLANLSYFMSGSTPIPMFVAQDASNNRQPITMEPALVFGSNRAIIVSFGTGRYLEVADNGAPFRAQSVYAILDNGTKTIDPAQTLAAIAGRASLAEPTTVSAASVDFAPFTWGRTGTTKAGWYFDFFGSGSVDANVDGDYTDTGDVRGTGERQISGMGVLAGKLIFGTVIPAMNSCDSGQGNLFVVDLAGGDSTILTSTVGILGEPFLAQVGASTLTGSDTTGRRRETTRYQIILQGSAGLAAPPSMGMDVNTFPGRLSWREISNYQELRNAP